MASWIATKLLGLRHVLFQGVPVSDRQKINFLGPGVTVADNPTEERIDVTIGSSTLDGLSLTSGGTVVEQWITAKATTTNSTPQTLITVPVASGQGVVVEYTLAAKILPDASTFVGAAWQMLAAGNRPQVGSPSGSSGGVPDAQLIVPPFWDPLSNGGSFRPGGPKLDVSGNNLLLQAWGLDPPSAWQASHFYATEGTLVTNGGKVYVLTANGTSAGAGGPSGTGAAITDGTATWAWVSSTPAAWASITITWTLVARVRFT